MPSTRLANVNGTLFFAASNGTQGIELWKSDGTSAGTVLVKDIIPGAVGSAPGRLTNVGGTLFFTVAYPGVYGVELWKSDGTEAGTVLVRDINPGIFDSSPSELTDFRGTLYFSAIDGVHGRELWKSDGTEAGTVLVRDLFPPGAIGGPEELRPVGDMLFFRSTATQSGAISYGTDGTGDGTHTIGQFFDGTLLARFPSLTNVCVRCGDSSPSWSASRNPCPPSPLSGGRQPPELGDSSHRGERHNAGGENIFRLHPSVPAIRAHCWMGVVAPASRKHGETGLFESKERQTW